MQFCIENFWQGGENGCYIKDPQEEGRTAKKFEENPRKLSMFGNLHLERCCWTLIHPWRALQQEKLFRLRVRVPFSVFQMIVDKFRTIPEWNIYKGPSSKRGRPGPLLRMMMLQWSLSYLQQWLLSSFIISLYAWPPCILNGSIRILKGRSSRMFLNNIRLLYFLDAVPVQIASTSRGITALKANAISSTVAMDSRLLLILLLSTFPGGFFQSLPVISVHEMTRP